MAGSAGPTGGRTLGFQMLDVDPVQLARATRARLALASPRTLEVHEALFDRGDRAALRVLTEGHASG
jgi:hypothetical protein